jgi:hypothetical protein
MQSNTTGNFNTSFGAFSMNRNITGIRNTGVGTSAQYWNNGSDNTAIGYEALNQNTTGERNVAAGTNAMRQNISGSNNTAIGDTALFTNVTGSNNTAVGKNADVLSPNLTNATAIGYAAKAGASNSFILGGTGANVVNVGIGTSTPLSRLHVVSNGTANALELENGPMKVSGANRTAFKHVTAAGNLFSNRTNIPNTTFANSPNDILIVTHDFDSNGPYLNSAYGVWWNGANWTIYTEDVTAMLAGLTFNVLVIKQ